MNETRASSIEHNPFARKIAALGVLSGKEKAILERLCRRQHRFEMHTDLMYQGQRIRRAYLLISGWANAYKMRPDGTRQIIDIRVPGDFLGLQSILLHQSDYAIRPVIDMQVAEIAIEDLFEVLVRSPRLAEAILWTVSQDSAAGAERLVSLGRRTATERIAHFMLELGARLALVGHGDDTGYECPLTQYHLADALGLSAVHTNRVLRHLRDEGVLTFRDGHVLLDARDRLIALAGFDPAPLYLRRTTLPTAEFLKKLHL